MRLSETDGTQTDKGHRLKMGASRLPPQSQAAARPVRKDPARRKRPTINSSTSCPPHASGTYTSSGSVNRLCRTMLFSPPAAPSNKHAFCGIVRQQLRNYASRTRIQALTCSAAGPKCHRLPQATSPKAATRNTAALSAHSDSLLRLPLGRMRAGASRRPVLIAETFGWSITRATPQAANLRIMGMPAKTTGRGNLGEREQTARRGGEAQIRTSKKHRESAAVAAPLHRVLAAARRQCSPRRW